MEPLENVTHPEKASRLGGITLRINSHVGGILEAACRINTVMDDLTAPCPPGAGAAQPGGKQDTLPAGRLDLMAVGLDQQEKALHKLYDAVMRLEQEL